MPDDIDGSSRDYGLPNDLSELADWLKNVHLDHLADNIIRPSLTLYDWTAGCIALTDKDIDEIYAVINIPTKIIIEP